MSKSYTLKHPGSCSGMFWRDAPTPELKKSESVEAVRSTGFFGCFGGNTGTKPDWPKNGAVLKGEAHVLEKPVQGCNKWLQVEEYCQAGSSKWEKTPNCWMQFEQGGLLLHEKA